MPDEGFLDAPGSGVQESPRQAQLRPVQKGPGLRRTTIRHLRHRARMEIRSADARLSVVIRSVERILFAAVSMMHPPLPAGVIAVETVMRNMRR